MKTVTSSTLKLVFNSECREYRIDSVNDVTNKRKNGLYYTSDKKDLYETAHILGNQSDSDVDLNIRYATNSQKGNW